MRPEARQALAGLIRECGKSIVRMPSSCQLYLAARLADFPEERELLSQALRHGIPEQILQHAGTPDYEAKLHDLAHDLAAATGLEPDTAAEAVSAWADALDRPPGYQKPTVPNKVYPDEAKPDPVAEKSLRLVMAAIAGAGGFLGTALGAGLAAAAFVATDAAVDDPRATPVEAGAHGLAAVAILVKMLIAGTAGGLAAAAGWLCGKGDDKPWAGFAAAFGAGFTMALVLLSFRASLVRIAIVAGAVYGAAFTAASRGGHKA